MKKLKYILLGVSALAVTFACKDDPAFEMPKSGGITELVVIPGNGRVTVAGTRADDARAAKIEARWKEGEAEKTKSFDLSGSAYQHDIPLPEGAYLFEIFTFDANGGQIARIPMQVKSYGPNYIKTLTANRPIKERKKTGSNVVIEWADNPSGSIKTEVTYSKSGVTEPVKVVVAPSEGSTTLEQFEGEEFSITSFYYPEPARYIDPATKLPGVPAGFAFDLFPTATPKVEFLGGPSDVTSKYLKNASKPIEGTDSNGKWGLPKDWKITDNIHNQEGNTLGGWKWENDDVKGIIHLETQNWSGPGYENGKVWQTAKLPAGTYSFTANCLNGNGSSDVHIYVAAAEGNSLPNIDKLGEALAYKKVDTDTKGEFTITFTIPAEADVSLGLVVTLEGTEHWQQFDYFSLVAIPTADVTAAYIKNAGPEFKPEKVGLGDNKKWGTPKDWNTTDNLNWREDKDENGTDVKVGSWASEDKGRLQFENPGWSDTPVVNAKYWQTATLPKGYYRMSFEYCFTYEPAVTHLHYVAAKGKILPDAEELATKAIAYAKIDDPSKQWKVYSLDFEVTEPTEVSLGFVANLTGGPTYVGLAKWVRLHKFSME